MAFSGRVGLNLTATTGNKTNAIAFNQDIYQRIAMARGLYDFFGKEGIISGGASVVGDLTSGTKYPAVSLLLLDDSNEVWFFDTRVDSNINLSSVSNTSIKLYAQIVLDISESVPYPAKGSRTDISFIALNASSTAPINSILLGTGTTNAGFTTIIAYTPESIHIPSIADLGVGGSDTQVQFNDGGSSLGGDAGLTYNKTTNVLSLEQSQYATGLTAPSHSEGRVFYDKDANTLAIMSDISGPVLQVGQEQWIRVINKTGADIEDGSAVYIVGQVSQLPSVAKAKADVIGTTGVVGFATHTIATNDEGWITAFGLVRGLNTNSLIEGSTIYLSATTAGSWTSTAPSSPNYVVPLGHCLYKHVNLGILLVDVDSVDQSVATVDSARITGALTAGSVTSNQFSNFVDTQRYGFLNQTETTIAFDGTSVFTLGASGSWSYYRTGIKHTIGAGNKTIDLLTVENPLVDGRMYYIYIDGTTGALSASTVSWTLLDTKVPVATIKWNNTLTPKYQMAEERHSCLIDRRYHYAHHFTDGTKVISVGALTGATINSDVDADKTFSIAQSVICDEDLAITLSTLDDPNGVDANYVVAYRTGASSFGWKASAMPFVYNVGNTNNIIQYDNGTSGMVDCGTGTGSNTRWVNSYLMMTNINGSARYLFFMGQAEYTTLAGAQAENVANLKLTGLPTVEGVITHRITWSTITSTSKGKCVMAVLPVSITGTSLQGTGGSSTIDHNTLSNLAVGDVHTQYTLLAGRTGGQTLIGGTGASENLTLQSTSNATRGSIILNCCPSIFDATSSAKGIQFGDGASGYDVQLYRQGANQLRTPDSFIADLNTFIGDTSNAKATLGLTINQGAADDEILALKSSDVSHGFTDLTEADTYGTLKKGSSTGGGLLVSGFAEANTIGLQLFGAIGSTDPADTIPSIILQGNRLSGATTTALASTEIVLDMMNNASTIFRLRGAGGFWAGPDFNAYTQQNTYSQKYEMVGGNLFVWDPTTLGAEIHTNNTATADPNGTEANATTGWSGVSATLSATTGDKYAGTYSMLVTGTSTSGRAEYDFTTIAGKMYKISIWAKRGAQGTTQRFTAWTGFSGVTGAVSVTASWAEYVFYVIATGTTGKIRAYCNSGGSIGDELYIDNMSIKEVIGGNISLTGKLTGGAGTTGLKIDSAGSATLDGSLTISGDASVIGTTTITEGKNIVLGTTTGTQIGTGATQKLVFYGGTPIVRPSALTTQLTTVTFTAGTPDYAWGAGTNTSAWGFTSQDEFKTNASVIANLQTRVSELETKLKALGLLS